MHKTPFPFGLGTAMEGWTHLVWTVSMPSSPYKNW